MIRSTPFVKLFAVLCLIALFGAQIFGLARGYVCDCAGQTEWTAQDHCAGPHGRDCHRDVAADHRDNDDHGAQNRRDHEQVRDEVQSRLAQSIDVPMPVPFLVVFFGEEAAPCEGAAQMASFVQAGVDFGPPLGVVVARTTVLLI